MARRIATTKPDGGPPTAHTVDQSDVWAVEATLPPQSRPRVRQETATVREALDGVPRSRVCGTKAEAELLRRRLRNAAAGLGVRINTRRRTEKDGKVKIIFQVVSTVEDQA